MNLLGTTRPMASSRTLSRVLSLSPSELFDCIPVAWENRQLSRDPSDVTNIPFEDYTVYLLEVESAVTELPASRNAKLRNPLLSDDRRDVRERVDCIPILS